MTVLVAGATGLVGGLVARRLRDRGVAVRALVRDESARVQALRVLGCETSKGDLKVPESLAQACTGADALVITANSAMSRRAGDSIRSVDRDGVLGLLDAAAVARLTQVVECYTRGRQLWERGASDPRAIPLLEEAVALQPDYVPALAFMVSMLATRFITSADPADLERAIEISDRVLAVDPQNAQALSGRGYTLWRMNRMAEALETIGRAVAVEGAGDNYFPHYFCGGMLVLGGRIDESVPHLQRAMKIEPRFGMGWLALGWAFYSLQELPGAQYALRRAKAVEGQPGPSFVAGTGGFLAECLRSEGRLVEARQEALAGVHSIEQSDHMYRDSIRAFCLGALGRVAATQGDRPAAVAAFTQAVAQMRGRTLTLAGGHAIVQALAGLAVVTGDAGALDEANDLLATRTAYSFKPIYGCCDWFTLLELAQAARAFGRDEEASQLFDRAREAGWHGPEPAAAATLHT